MRLLFVVQRYGTEIGGGAEQLARWVAEGLTTLGHSIHVGTSCALDYMTWANHYDAGVGELNGVTVHRFPVSQPRNVAAFNQLSERIDFRGGSTSVALEEEWLIAQGPNLEGFEEWLDSECERFDAVVVFTYLYRTAQVALRTCVGRVPVAMHATAHDEPPFYLRTIQSLLQGVSLFLCSTPEEMDLLQANVPSCPRAEVVGIGVSNANPDSLSVVLDRCQIPEKPFALILGRVDASKGVLEGIDFFESFLERFNSSLRLVVVGKNVAGLTSSDHLSLPGFVSDAEVSGLLHGAEFLIQPSYYESFSLALCEAWLAGTPTLANALCHPVAGQTRRSGGGLLYSGREDFVNGAQRLHTKPRLRRRLGVAGRQFVQQNFESRVVLERIDFLLTGL